MRRRDLILALTAAAIAGPAVASGHGGGGEGGSSPAGQNIDMAPMALPIVLDGRLVNYVFVQIRINLASAAAMDAFRAREPYLRDALIRAAHRTPFTLRSDLTRVDENRVRATLMPLAAAIAGPRAIASIVITSQTPRQRYGLPRPAGRGAAIVP